MWGGGLLTSRVFLKMVWISRKEYVCKNLRENRCKSTKMSKIWEKIENLTLVGRVKGLNRHGKLWGSVTHNPNYGSRVEIFLLASSHIS